VLEIGSGTGLMSQALEQTGFIVQSIEPSREMVKIAMDNHRFPTQGISICTIQDFSSEGKTYDLVLCLYDVLNYVPFDEISVVIKKIKSLSKHVVIEMWKKGHVYPFTYKKNGQYKRVRLALRWFNNCVYLVYIYWGKGICIDTHKIHLHE